MSQEYAGPTKLVCDGRCPLVDRVRSERFDARACVYCACGVVGRRLENRRTFSIAAFTAIRARAVNTAPLRTVKVYNKTKTYTTFYKTTCVPFTATLLL